MNINSILIHFIEDLMYFHKSPDDLKEFDVILFTTNGIQGYYKHAWIMAESQFKDKTTYRYMIIPTNWKLK